MKTTEVVSGPAFTDLHLAQLVDQMDSSIGEATSVMGAMVQEIIRRSLRGGVLQIGRELHNYVGEQVGMQIVAQAPVIERTAVATALARATEIVREGLASVEQSAREGDELLAARMSEAERHAAAARERLTHEVSQRFEIVTRQGEEATRQLTTRIEDTSRQAEVVALSLTERLVVTAKETEAAKAQLAGRIDDAARQADEAKAQLASRIEDTARQAEETATTLARRLANDIATAEQRAMETARADFKTQLGEVRDRARKTMAAIRERLDTVELIGTDLSNLHQQLKRDLLDALGETQKSLTDEVEGLREINRELLERVETLERPRGFFAWLFGRTKKKAAPKVKPVAHRDADEVREVAAIR